MPSEVSRRDLSLPHKRIIAGFDEAAKGLAEGTISRRRALKMTGAALLGAALVPFSSAPAEAAGTCRNRPAISNRRCPADEAICHQTETQLCLCATTASGNKRCVELSEASCEADPCERTRDCPEGEICVKIGECCNEPKLKVCAPQCVIS